MTEGFDPAEVPTRRGRRSPEIAAAMLEDDQLAPAGEVADQSYVGLVAGDTVIGKVTFAAQTRLGDAWYMYGAQSQVLPGETAEMAYERVSGVISDGVLGLAGDFETRIDEVLEEDRRNSRRIPQR